MIWFLATRQATDNRARPTPLQENVSLTRRSHESQRSEILVQKFAATREESLPISVSIIANLLPA
jgi:hypothetical protein